MTQIKMIRVYETVFEFDTDDKDKALEMFGDLGDKYSLELGQCCVVEEEILLPGEKVIFDPFEN